MYRSMYRFHRYTYIGCIVCRTFLRPSSVRWRTHTHTCEYRSMYRFHRRCIYEGDTSTHAQGTDPRVAISQIYIH